MRSRNTEQQANQPYSVTPKHRLPFVFDELDRKCPIDLTTSRVDCHWLLRAISIFRRSPLGMEISDKSDTKKKLSTDPLAQKIFLLIAASIHYK